MSRITPLFALLTASIVAALVAFSPEAQADERPGREPGLPYIECTPQLAKWQACNPEFGDKDMYGWLNTNQNGLAGAVKSKQWARVPVGVVAVNASFVVNNQVPPFEDLRPNGEYTFAQAFLVSPAGSGTNYGDSVDIPVRTVAFGSIPVEVTLQVRQRRDARNLPVPINIDSLNYRDDEAMPDGSVRVTFEPTRIRASVAVRVRSLKVDGVDVGLGTRCQTPHTAQLDVVSEKFVAYDRGEIPDRSIKDFDPAHGFQGVNGGTLNGSISIPSFGGCATRSGDDVSPILTSAISGSGNPVSIRTGSLTCTRTTPDGFSFLPPKPGAVTDPKDCKVQYPEANPRIVPIPKQFDIPDNAPSRIP